jgi:type I restriction enzyme S subunit
MRDDWTQTTLGSIAEVVGGGTPSTTNPSYWDGDVVWLTPTEIVSIDGKHVDSSERLISVSGLQNSGARLLPVGTVILTSRASVGFAAISDVPLCTNQGFQSLVPGPDVINEFLLRWIQWNRPEFNSRSAGSTFKEISKTNVKSMPINLPPLAEQKRIVDVVSSVDIYIESLQSQVDAARTARNAVLHEILSAGGDDWTETTLGEVCDVRDGTHDSPKQSEVGYPLVTSKNIRDGKVDMNNLYLISESDFHEINKRSKVDKFDLLISMIGTVGEVCYEPNEPNYAIKNVGLIKTGSELLGRFLLGYLSSRMGKEQIELSTSGSTQKFIGLGKLRSLRILLPPLAEQERIVDVVTSMDDVIQTTESTLSEAKRLRSGLLSDLLSGEHEIPESYDRFLDAA